MKLSRVVGVLALVAALRVAGGPLPEAIVSGFGATTDAGQTAAAGRMGAPASAGLAGTAGDRIQAAPTQIAGSAWNLDGLHAFLAWMPSPLPAPAPVAHAPAATPVGLPHGPPHFLHDALRI